MKTVAIVDYGMSNLDSVARAVEVSGGIPLVSGLPPELAAADAYILPGVGAFREGMRQIRQRGLDRFLHEQISLGKPLLGICLGMQLLAALGTEGGETTGLGLIPGRVVRLQPESAAERVPHVGWNELHVVRESPLWAQIPPAKDFYFVHSYHVECDNPDLILARTPYCGSFVSAVGDGTVFGVQFHPEKSHRFGLQLLKNFLEL